MNKNIILAGVIAIGIYLFSQGKAIFSAHPTQTTRQKVAQKVDIFKLPVQQIRYLIERAAALGKTGKGVAALKAEEARRVAAWKVAVRKAAAQKIGKKIGKKVAQKVLAQKGGIALMPVEQLRYKIAHAQVQNIPKKEVAAWKAEEARRVVAWKAAAKKKKNEVAKKKEITSKLFSGSEKSRVIPYSESSKHSYYGPKSHKVLNEGYMEKRYKADLKQAEEDEMNALFAMFPEYSSI